MEVTAPLILNLVTSLRIGRFTQTNESPSLIIHKNISSCFKAVALSGVVRVLCMNVEMHIIFQFKKSFHYMDKELSVSSRTVA